MLTLLGNFLSEIQQRVLLNRKFSAWKNISAGVPQGSVLGPLLFLIYINDLLDSLQSTPYLFADDVSLFDPIYNPIVTTETLNNNLSMIGHFSGKCNLIQMLTSKLLRYILRIRERRENIPHLLFNGITVNTVNSHKHLGLILDQKLTFADHFNEKIAKANKGIGVIKTLFIYTQKGSSKYIYIVYQTTS